MPGEHLVLVGAGHAHLYLINSAERLTRAGFRVTVIAPRWFDYSGTASSIATGGRDPAAGRIDVAALTHGRVEHRQVRVTAVDLATRTVRTSADPAETIQWDVLSVNVGSVAHRPAGLAVDESAIGVKPLSDLAELRERLTCSPVDRGHRVTVVGAGPSGIELAANLAARSDTEVVRLLESDDHLAPGLPVAAVRRLCALLSRRGVQIRTGARLVEIGAHEVVFADGTRLEHDHVVLATGLAPPPLATQPDLGGAEGIPVRDTLQHRDHDDVYAAGDCADFLPGTLPRIGVHGVRQGPVLLDALLGRGTGEAPPTYRPQSRALSVLDLGDGTGLAVRGRVWWLGRASLLLKGWLDRRWLSRYRH